MQRNDEKHKVMKSRFVFDQKAFIKSLEMDDETLDKFVEELKKDESVVRAMRLYEYTRTQTDRRLCREAVRQAQAYKQLSWINRIKFHLRLKGSK